jgi:hypothetical protein
MIKGLRVGKRVEHKRDHYDGKIVEVNNYWGWYVVEWGDGQRKTYTSDLADYESPVIIHE